MWETDQIATVGLFHFIFPAIYVIASYTDALHIHSIIIMQI